MLAAGVPRRAENYLAKNGFWERAAGSVLKRISSAFPGVFGIGNCGWPESKILRSLWRKKYCLLAHLIRAAGICNLISRLLPYNLCSAVQSFIGVSASSKFFCFLASISWCV